MTISTLKELFKGNKKLFKGLYIENKWKFEEHPVLIFDFNELTPQNPDKLVSKLMFLLKKYYKQYNLELPETDGISTLFSRLIQSLFLKYNQRIVILVDEYDKPIIDHLGKDRIETASIIFAKKLGRTFKLRGQA